MIKNKIILIANIPPPITGARYANKVSMEAMEDKFETVLISEDYNFFAFRVSPEDLFNPF